jgi:hypothetical protein
MICRSSTVLALLFTINASTAALFDVRDWLQTKRINRQRIIDHIHTHTCQSVWMLNG